MKKLLVFLITFLFVFALIGCILYFKIEPKIGLNGEAEIVLKLNEDYNDNGSWASILKKDISKEIKVSGSVDTSKVGVYKIKYSISNKFIKNNNSIVRVVKVVDDISPEIKLKGDEVSIYVGDKYNESGYSAIDNYDGDITDRVSVTNNIDNTKVGNYEVTYSVEDSSGNSVSIKRNVEVKEKPIVKATSSTSYSGNGLPVLMYHFFYDKSKGEVGEDNNWMEISSFEEQLKYLSDNDYYFPTWEEVADFVDGKITLPKKSIVLTVDDGHNSFFSLAVPVINKYDVKVTSFVVTSWTSSYTIGQYKNDKINFQTHTHNMHKGGCSGGHGGLFRCIDYNKGIDDLSNSVNILESRDAIAYPFGDVTDNVLKITSDVGIKLGFTTKYGKVYKGMDKLQLPRVRVNKGISLNGFINSIS